MYVWEIVFYNTHTSIYTHRKILVFMPDGFLERSFGENELMVPGMYVCVCMCMYICMHTSVHASMDFNFGIHVCMYVYMYACMYVSMYACVMAY